MTTPKCIVMRTPGGDDLGFLLLAVPAGATTGECVFMVFPRNPALFESPEAQALLARKARGESWVTISAGPPLNVRVESDGLPDLIIELATPDAADARAGGTWREAPPGTRAGSAALPPS